VLWNIFSPDIGNNTPILLNFFRGVETTIQFWLRILLKPGRTAPYLRTLGTVKELLEGGAMPMEVLKKRLGQGDDGLELS